MFKNIILSILIFVPLVFSQTQTIHSVSINTFQSGTVYMRYVDKIPGSNDSIWTAFNETGYRKIAIISINKAISDSLSELYEKKYEVCRDEDSLNAVDKSNLLAANKSYAINDSTTHIALDKANSKKWKYLEYGGIGGFILGILVGSHI